MQYHPNPQTEVTTRNQGKSLGKSFVVSFLLFSVFFSILVYLTQAKQTALAPQRRSDNAELTSEINSQLIQDTNRVISTAKEAKAQKLFWMYRNGNDQIALAIKPSPVLLNSLFPGYSPLDLKTIHDDLMMNGSYFEHSFEQGTYLEVLNTKSFSNNVIQTPRLACLDVHSRLGSNTILFGSSEVNNGVVLSMLKSTAFGKVVNCSNGGSTQSDITFNLDKIKSLQEGTSQPKLNQIVIGYSFWWSNFQNSDIARTAAIAKAEIDHWPQTSSSWFGKTISWNKFFPTGFSPIYKTIRPHSENLSTTHQPSSAVVKETKLTILPQSDEEEGFHFIGPRDSITNETLDHWSQNAKARYGRLAYMMNSDCDLQAARKQLSQMLETALQVSKHVYLYLTPTTPLQVRAAPSCLQPAVANMLKTFSSKEVSVKIDDWKAYDLDWVDFVHENPSNDGQEHWALDMNHANFSGAKKITSKLFSWIEGSSSP